MKNRIMRLVAVLVLAVGMSITPAFAMAASCPDLYMSTDGGATWTQCEHYGTISNSTTTWCYYYC